MSTPATASTRPATRSTARMPASTGSRVSGSSCWLSGVDWSWLASGRSGGGGTIDWGRATWVGSSGSSSGIGRTGGHRIDA